MHNVLGRGASSFFVNKLHHLLEKIEQNEENFVVDIREKRLDFMKIFRKRKDESAPVKGVNLDDFEDASSKAIDRSQGNQGQDRDEATQKMMMQIMQKLDDQKDELKQMKSTMTKRLDEQAATLASLHGSHQPLSGYHSYNPPPPTMRYATSTRELNSYAPNTSIGNTASLGAGVPSVGNVSPRQHRLYQLQSTRASSLIGEA